MMRCHTMLTLGLALALSLAALAGEEPSEPALTHGFRHDPMKFVNESTAVPAALVRRDVFRKPKAGDEAILKKRIDEILAKQKPDGHLADGIKGTAERLMQLIELGIDPKRPEVQRVARLLLAERTKEHSDNHKHISVRGARALIMLGMADLPEVKAAVETMIQREKVWSGAWKLCPWGTQLYLDALWEGRDLVDTRPIVKRTLTWIADQMNDAGCLSYKDPWSFVDCAGRIDTPEARRVVGKLLPMILRAQKPDGGWGDGHSAITLRALVTHGFLEKLRKLPPLPPDWKTVRTIPAPGADVRTLAFGGTHLWTLDPKANEAIALSPADGKVARRLKLPEGKSTAVGWWDDALAVVQGKPKRLLSIDVATGRTLREVPLNKLEWPHNVVDMGGEPWVYDAWFGCFMRVDPETPDKRRFHGIHGAGGRLARAGDTLWHIPDFAPLILRSHKGGKLLEWGEVPFAGGCSGLAWDGKHLWALDRENARIALIERARKADTGGGQ